METIQLHPVHQCNDGLFNSASGKKISLHKPTPEMICLEDIARGLDNICRFGGQISSHHSVAAHTLLVWHLAPEHLKPAALLHDAAEAYLGDVIKPLKVLLKSVYEPIERRFEELIFRKYHVDINLLPYVKPYDMQAVEIEHAYFHKGDGQLIEYLHEIREQLGWLTNHVQLLSLLKKHFFQYEINNG